MTEPGRIPQISGPEDAMRLRGRDLGVSDWMVVTQKNVDSFARSIDDWHWAHNEPDRAARGAFGGPIAHAHMTLASIPHLRESVLRAAHGELMFYGYDRVRFPSPVPVGAHVRLHAVVADVAVVDLGVQLTLDVRIEVEGQERPGCVARSIWRYYAIEAPD